MLFVISGEGPTDFGTCNNGQGSCEGNDFLIGPIAKLVDQLIEAKHNYSVASAHGFRFFSKSALELKAEQLKRGRTVALAGKKRGVETGFFFKNAWVLSNIAMEVEATEKDECVAILFRDCDGTNSAPGQLWKTKWDSMMQGFGRAGFARGVPAIPRPKSEAWLLCAAKQAPFQNCSVLENLPGNDGSPNSAKNQLDTALNHKTSRADLCEWIDSIHFDHDATARQMPSYMEFKERLYEVL